MHTEFYEAVRTRLLQYSIRTVLVIVTLLCAFLAGRASMLARVSSAERRIVEQQARANAAEQLYRELFDARFSEHLQQRYRERMEELMRQQERLEAEERRMRNRIFERVDESPRSIR